MNTDTVINLEALAAFMAADRKPGTPVIWWERPGADNFVHAEAHGLVRHASATQIEWTERGIEALLAGRAA